MALTPKRKMSFAQSEALGKAQRQKRANDFARGRQRLADEAARKEADRRAAEQAAQCARAHGWRNWEYDFDATPPMEHRTCRHCGATEERELKW